MMNDNDSKSTISTDSENKISENISFNSKDSVNTSDPCQEDQNSNEIPINTGGKNSDTEDDCQVFNRIPSSKMRSPRYKDKQPSFLFPIKTNWARLKEDKNDWDNFARLFPARKLNFYFGTWNMHDQKALPPRLIEFILPLEIEWLADVYIISTQESTSMIHKWIVAIQKILGIYYYMLVHSQFGSLSTLIFVRRDILWYCSVNSVQQISTRAGSKIKTKGAIIVKIIVFGTCFIIVNSHLASGDEEMEARINDYNKIWSFLKEECCFNPATDSVFWLGDLNFRLKGNLEDIHRILSSNQIPDKDKIKEILKFDTLNEAINSKTIFENFSEPLINFLPTYKVDIHTNQYLYKQRIPAYTDRILYFPDKNVTVECNHYNSTVLYTSDHRPVYAYFEIHIHKNCQGEQYGSSPGGYARKIYKKVVNNENKSSKYSKINRSTSYCSIQ